MGGTHLAAGDLTYLHAVQLICMRSSSPKCCRISQFRMSIAATYTANADRWFPAGGCPSRASSSTSAAGPTTESANHDSTLTSRDLSAVNV